MSTKIRAVVVILIAVLAVGLVKWASKNVGGAWEGIYNEYSLLSSVVVLDTDDVWTAGIRGQLFHYDGKEWQYEQSPVSAKIYSMSTPDRKHIWASGASGVILFYDGSKWTRRVSGTNEDLTGIYALNKEVWSIGREGGIYHYDGSWSKAGQIEGLGFRGITVTKGGVWIVGTSGLFFYDGKVNKVMDGSFSCISTNGSNVWAVSQQYSQALMKVSTVYFYDGTWKNVFKIPDCRINTVFAEGKCAWLGGDCGTVIHYDGKKWDIKKINPFSEFHSIYALGGQVWAAGEGTNVIMLRNASLWHYDKKWENEI